MNIRDINEKHANATSVSSLDIRNTRRAHRNLQQIHLGFVDCQNPIHATSLCGTYC